MTPATAASTTGKQHNFCSGQTLLEHAPSGRTEPNQGDCADGNASVNVCEPREGFRPDHRPDAPIQPHGRFETSMIRGVRFTTTLECVCRDAQLTSAMATSVRATPWQQGVGRASQSFSRERVWQGDTGTTRILTAARRARRARRSCPLEVCMVGTRDCPRKRLDRSSRSTAQAEARDRRTLEGNQKPTGGQAIGGRKRRTVVQTHPRSKALKSTLTARDGLNGASGNADPGGSSSAARERQEGSRPW